MKPCLVESHITENSPAWLKQSCSECPLRQKEGTPPGEVWQIVAELAAAHKKIEELTEQVRLMGGHA